MACDGGTTVYFHWNCNDGHVALGLLVAHLLQQRTRGLRVQSVTASMRRFVYPPAGTDTAYFVDLCPRPDMVARLEECAQRIVVLDHHISARDTAARAEGRPQWTFHLHMDACGAQIVERVFPRARDGWLSSIDRALEYVADYDLWRRADDDVFCFKTGLELMWFGCTMQNTPTTPGECAAFMTALAATPCSDIVAAGRPKHDAAIRDYAARKPFAIRLAPPTAAWDGVAVGVELDSASNPSLLCHWLLRDFPDAEVAVGLYPARDGERRVSLRSRTLCLPRSAGSPEGCLEWAFGHARACGGVLPPGAVETILPMHTL